MKTEISLSAGKWFMKSTKILNCIFYMAKYFFILFFAILSGSASAQDTLSITLENVKYPYPVRLLNLKSEGQDLRMAYMDVHPVSPNGRTVILFDGKNFGGYYWEDVIWALNGRPPCNYRMIEPCAIIVFR
jgi:hypothetical protein